MTQPAIVRDRHPATAWAVLLAAAVGIQLVLSYLFNVRTSFYVADDINAIELAHQTGFLSYVQTPVDVHRVPLHRAVNYLMHHLLPMRFDAATLFMLSCHALAVLMLYRLLQRLNDSAINGWLVAAYALNAYVPIPLHWWSAGLHRFPFVLASVISCYGFFRFYQTGKYTSAVLAFCCAAIAAGFYIKAILIPLYWAAILFCVMDFHAWRNYLRQYLAIMTGGLFSLAYVTWYLYSNTYSLIDSSDAVNIVRIGMQWGISTVAQMPLQMPFRMELATWINLAWLVVLAAFAIRVRGAWRAILVCLVLVAINLLMITTSSRASRLGALMMLAPHYYYDVLFLLAIFGSLMCRNVGMLARVRSASGARNSAAQRRAIATWLLAAVAIAAYAAAGWHTVLRYTRPGPDENHWRCAHYERNLMDAIATTGIENLNLVDAPLPDFFVYDPFDHKPLMLSTYLSWHGMHPQFDQQGKPRQIIDPHGNLQPAIEPTNPNSG